MGKDTTTSTANNAPPPPKPNDQEYPTGLRFALIITSIFATLFLVNLDKLIISTAIPRITDEFKSPSDVGWYGTAYLLTKCSFQLEFGKVYKHFPVKSTFLLSTLVFEAGSALCGAAPTSTALIVGRAVAGLGAGGSLPGAMTILVHTVPMHLRPRYQGIFGAIFGVASVLGPTVGGAFTTHVTWRWCFYINLPIGGAVMALMFFSFQTPEEAKRNSKMPLREKLKHLNLLGCICVVPGVTCLCLALQWGGTTYAWINAKTIALLTLSLALFLAFILIQFRLPAHAMLPPRLFLQRSIASGFWTSIYIGAHQTLFLYYLPIYFQTIGSKTAVQSGLDLLAMVLPSAAVALANGQFIAFLGYYTPSLLAGVSLTAIGAGLLTTFGVHTSEAKWAGYQIVYGCGLGLASQAPNMAAQTVLPKPDIAIGTSLMFFGQNLFGAIFVSVGQNILLDQLTARLSRRIPGLTTSSIINTGATEILDTIAPAERATALAAYDESLRRVFQVALIMACLAVPGAMGMEMRSVKKEKGAPTVGGGEKELQARETGDGVGGGDRRLHLKVESADGDGVQRAEGVTVVERDAEAGESQGPEGGGVRDAAQASASGQRE